MRIAVFISDSVGPYQLTIAQPHKWLLQYGVETECFMTMPSDEGAPGMSFNKTLNQCARFDIIMLQRVTSLHLFQLFRKVCDILGKPLVLVLDDDYLHLEEHNPCFWGTALSGLPNEYRDLRRQGKVKEAEALKPMLEVERVQGLEQLKRAWSLPDCVITTTPELREVILPYNKNVYVFPNQMEQVFWESDYALEEMRPDGSLPKLTNDFGLATVPAFWPKPLDIKDPSKGSKPTRILRIGYSGTSSHMEDFKLYKRAWDKLATKYGGQVWFVYVGDPWFADQQIGSRRRRHWIREAPYEVYRYNLRNLDIGIAPLEPTPFNMSKSDLKMLEYSSWGACGVCSRYCTYNRPGGFVDRETAMMFGNEKEFYEVMEELINNPALRKQIGKNARDYVYKNRLEKLHSERRFKLYKHLVERAPGLRKYTRLLEAA